LPMGLKAWIVFAFPTLVLCTQRLGSDTFSRSLALNEAKEAAAPVLTSYFFVGAALFGITVFKLFRRRYREALLDFVFVAFALCAEARSDSAFYGKIKYPDD